MNESVDAVITWVDGYDRSFSNRMLAHLKQHHQSPDLIEPTRFNQCNEITYCVRSILKFAPWIRTIYIVTDAQIPSIIQQLAGTPFAEKVKCVDHRDIFYGFEEYLPTYNSLTIEFMLWRIPGLSEHFIYFNDDCFLVRPVKKSDFFRGNQSVVRGQWKTFSTSWVRRLLNCCSKPEAHRLVQENSARLCGYRKRCFHLPHVPFSLTKQDFHYFFEHYTKTCVISYAITVKFGPFPLLNIVVFNKKRPCLILD
jgi:hypothetical protein